MSPAALVVCAAVEVDAARAAVFERILDIDMVDDWSVSSLETVWENALDFLYLSGHRGVYTAAVSGAYRFRKAAARWRVGFHFQSSVALGPKFTHTDSRACVREIVYSVNIVGGM